MSTKRYTIFPTVTLVVVLFKAKDYYVVFDYAHGLPGVNLVESPQSIFKILDLEVIKNFQLVKFVLITAQSMIPANIIWRNNVYAYFICNRI